MLHNPAPPKGDGEILEIDVCKGLAFVECFLDFIRTQSSILLLIDLVFLQLLLQLSCRSYVFAFSLRYIPNSLSDCLQSMAQKGLLTFTSLGIGTCSRRAGHPVWYLNPPPEHSNPFPTLSGAEKSWCDEIAEAWHQILIDTSIFYLVIISCKFVSFPAGKRICG